MKNSLQATSYKLQAKHRGQTMLITVLLLSTAIMGAAALSGLLAVYNARNVADIVSSSEAVFAADAGLECSLYNNVKQPITAEPCGERDLTIRLSNGAEFWAETKIDTTGPIKTTTIRSTGYSDKATRAFEASYIF